MRLDNSLVALYLSGLAGAQWHGYNSTNGTNSTGSANGQLISQLQSEIQDLRQKLAEAGSACDGNGSGGTASSLGGSGSAAATNYASVAPSNGQGAGWFPQASSAASGAGGAKGASPSAQQQGGSPDVSTYVTTITNQYSTVVSTVFVTATLAPAASSDGASQHSSAAASSYGSSAAAGVDSASSASAKTPDYYAPQPPASTSTSTSTVTIIVNAGQSAPATSGATSDAGVETRTETYAGSNTVPSQPASTSQAGVSSTGSASSSAAGSFSGSSSAPYGYSNGTTLVFPTGSSSAPYGFSSGTTRVSPSGSTAVSNSTTRSYPTGSSAGTAVSSFAAGSSANATSASSSSASASATAAANLTDCSSLCSTLTNFNGWEVTPETCTQLKAGTLVNTPSGQSSVGCAASFTPAIDVCQVTLNVKTSGTANTYMEVWLPNGNSSSWNGRTMSTDNGGLNGCVHYVDMQYVSSMGFAAIGDNAGHNGSSFDGTWTMNNNEAVVDWAWRARHASVDIGKQLVNQFYSKQPSKSYYIGCSAGGAQGLQSAQKFPNDFDGIISGSSANDFNHLQDWSAHFRQITGASGNDTFLSVNDWTTVQSYILSQCDEPLDGVADGILEDPTLCNFDISVIPVCNDTVTSGCLSATQIDTVEQVFKPLYNGNDLIYPALLYGAQVDAFKLGLLSGSIQGISQDFFRGAVYNDSSFNILNIGPADWNRADQLDNLHGNPSAFSGDLSGFSAAGKKLMVYHGMADPMTSGTNSQRYYQKVAATMGLSNTEIDNFMRFYRISGMAHCGVGGISGAGAWMFGQSGAAASATDNIVSNLVDWVENDAAPDSLLGTKFWYDTPSMGIEFERRHCRYPYRTTYKGGDSTKPDSWGCDLIENWQDCEGVTCNADGTFT